MFSPPVWSDDAQQAVQRPHSHNFKLTVRHTSLISTLRCSGAMSAITMSCWAFVLLLQLVARYNSFFALERCSCGANGRPLQELFSGSVVSCFFLPVPVLDDCSSVTQTNVPFVFVPGSSFFLRHALFQCGRSTNVIPLCHNLQNVSHVSHSVVESGIFHQPIGAVFKSYYLSAAFPVRTRRISRFRLCGAVSLSASRKDQLSSGILSFRVSI